MYNLSLTAAAAVTTTTTTTVNTTTATKTNESSFWWSISVVKLHCTMQSTIYHTCCITSLTQCCWCWYYYKYYYYKYNYNYYNKRVFITDGVIILCSQQYIKSDVSPLTQCGHYYYYYTATTTTNTTATTTTTTNGSSMRYNKGNKRLELSVSIGNCFPTVGKYYPPSSASGNISPTSGKQFPIVTSTTVTICIIYHIRCIIS